MAEPELVIKCDHCNRVAIEIVKGQLKIIHRHDKEQHQTVVTLPPAVLTKMLESVNNVTN